MKCILINNFINFTKSARTNVTTQDIKIQLTSIKYFTNKLEKLVIIAQKENAQVIIPKIWFTNSQVFGKWFVSISFVKNKSITFPNRKINKVLCNKNITIF